MELNNDSRELGPVTASNMDAIKSFVERNVLVNITGLAPSLFSNDPLRVTFALMSDFTNYYYYVCPSCHYMIHSEWNELKSANDVYKTSIYKDSCRICPGCHEIIATCEQEQESPDEFYIVTSILGQRLIEQGECVLPRSSGYVWARKSTGKPLSLDDSVIRVVHDLGLFHDP